ncbi:hypothetical protein [Thalassotalea euphylliae]|uniref:DUF3570 domain-containing protein n=1 Tax=Thalassotalea euphylliae TaxID=1655234 RepID=A0A3E0UJZ6_9GAMM|nr:hypothetical protein [Thalassotalea euphylliae]REL37196.1 hypothetical protein DXX92_18795 [Thalassotalea euphylliae]
MTRTVCYLRKLAWLLISGVFIAPIVNAQQTAAEPDNTPPQTIEKPQNPIKPDEQFTIVGSQSQAEIDWMESLHSKVSDTVFRSAFWFDGFFTDNDDDDRERPNVKARIRLGWEPKARDLSGFDNKFRVRLKLPHFKDRLDLIFSDDEEDSLSQLPLEVVNTREQVEDDSFAAAVRFVHHSDSDHITDTRLGVSSGDIFVRARHKSRYSWNKTHGLRVEPALFYFVDDGLGARLLLEYDYQLSLRNQFRFDYSIRGSESFSGIRWKHGFYHLHQYSLKRAGALGLVIEGERNGENGFIIDNYTLSYRYRFNAYKRWLFFEVEPFLEWPEDENYKTTPGIALRVEGYFYKNQ